MVYGAERHRCLGRSVSAPLIPIVQLLQLGDALLDRGGPWEYISLFRVNPQKMILN